MSGTFIGNNINNNNNNNNNDNNNNNNNTNDDNNNNNNSSICNSNCNSIDIVDDAPVTVNVNVETDDKLHEPGNKAITDCKLINFGGQLTDNFNL